jgi:transposase
MNHLEGTDRRQIEVFTLDEAVDKEHVVRIIDKFADILDYEASGFLKAVPKTVGRPPYSPKHMVKLYLYGYLSGVRSSRNLEHLTKESLPAMWLMNRLAPDFKTIADFRRDNIEALTKVFYEFGSFLDGAGMFGKKTIAIDGTKVRASNNKKNNYSAKKIANRLEYNREKVEEYLKALEKADSFDKYEETEKKLKDCRKKIEKYEGYQKRLEETGEGELSEVDGDARLMGNNRGGVDVSYNIQGAADAEHSMVVEFDVTTNPTDHRQLANMTKKTQEALRKKDITVLADKGYYNGGQLAESEKLGATTVVSKQKNGGNRGKDKSFHIDKFIYDSESDTYTCPQGEVLSSRNSRKAKQRHFFNKDACGRCRRKDRCLTGKAKFRKITRGVYGDVYDRADKRFRENTELYKIRQQTIEHVFGTIKRTMGGGYFLLRTKEKVKCETALLFLGYNLKRTVNVLGFRETMERLDKYAEKIGCRTVNAAFSFVSGVVLHIISIVFIQRSNHPVGRPDF